MAQWYSPGKGGILGCQRLASFPVLRHSYCHLQYHSGSMEVQIVQRRPGENYYMMYATVTSHMLVIQFCNIVPMQTVYWE